jgi:vacuolar-type H+-ATPase subunit D/Vma8
MSKNKNQRLGKYIASVPPEKEKVEECPSLEVLSKFMENRCQGRERDVVIHHLNRCPACFSLVSEAIAIEEELQADRQTATRQIWQTVRKSLTATVDGFFGPYRKGTRAWLAVPAVAILVVAFFTVYRSQKVPDYFSLISSLENATQSYQMMSRNQADQYTSAVYGFFDGLSLERAAFRIGVLAYNLELAIRSKDREHSLSLLKPLFSLLTEIDRQGNAIKEFQRLKNELEKGTVPLSVTSALQTIHSLLEQKEVSFFMLFGVWVQGGGIAADNRNAAFFDNGNLDYFSHRVRKLELPPGIISHLDVIESIMEADRLSNGDYKILADNFNAILQILM